LLSSDETVANIYLFSIPHFWFGMLTCDAFNFHQVHNTHIKLNRFILTKILD